MIITSISDLGQASIYTSWMESHIKNEFPEAVYMPLSHDVQPFKVIEAAYLWKCTGTKFPDATFHISVFDILLNFPSPLMVVREGNNYYLSIDNGLLTAAFHKDDTTQYFATKRIAAHFSDYIQLIIDTLSLLSKGGIDEQHFISYQPKIVYNFPRSIIHANRIDCLILQIDRYDNIITDFTKDVFDHYLKDKKYTINLQRNETISEITFQPEYSSRGGLMAYFNDFGFMQISMRNKNSKTASILGFHTYQVESAFNSYISIEFD